MESPSPAALDPVDVDNSPREYFDEYLDGEYERRELELELPPLLTRKARIIPLPPASPYSAFEVSSSPVSSFSKNLKSEDLISENHSKWSFSSEYEAQISPLWEADGDEDVSFTMGFFGNSWDVDSSSSSSTESSSSSSLSEDDDDAFSDSDSGYTRNGSPLEFIDHSDWCRGYSISSSPARSLFFRVDHNSIDLGDRHSLVEGDNNKELSALTILSSNLTRALPLELHEARREGVKMECNGFGSLSVIIGEKQERGDLTSKKKSGWDLGLGLGITALSVKVVHSLGSFVGNSEDSCIGMKTQFILLRYILAWAQREWSSTLEVVGVELPEAFIVPKDYLSTHAEEFQGDFKNSNSAAALHTLSWTGDVQFLPEILKCFSERAVRGIEKLQVSSEISVDDALLLLGRFEGLGAGLREVEIGGAGVGGCEPVLLPEYMECESGGQVVASYSGIRVDRLLASASPSPSSKKLSLPKLDTLQITASVSLAAFFAAVDIPRLCKLELDLGDEGDEMEADATLGALFEGVLMPSSSRFGEKSEENMVDGMIDGVGGGGLLYLDVRHGGTFEIGERLKELVLQREPGAYVSINGWK